MSAIDALSPAVAMVIGIVLGFAASLLCCAIVAGTVLWSDGSRRP